MRLTLTAASAVEVLDGAAAPAGGRVLRGLALPYNVTGWTSAGPIRVTAGAVRLPAELRRVKLFREHGRTDPVGYATASSEDPAAGLSMAFQVARTPAGDAAILEASEGVRDALSVELDAVELDDTGLVTAADLVAVVLTAVPAFADARLVASRSDSPDQPAGAAIPAPAGDPAQPEGPPAVTVTVTAPPTPTTPPAPTPTTPPDPPAPTPPAPVTAAVVPHGTVVTTSRGPRTVVEAARQLANVVRGAVDAGQVNAALADVVPADDTAGAFFGRPEWLGELWTPEDGRRPWTTAIGPARPLTSMTFQGWKWETKPQVAVWAGNKTPIPSNPVKIVPATGTAQRVAGGWDVDRVFVDLGEAGFLEALFRAATVDYGVKSNAYIGAALAAAATDAGDALDLVAGLSLAVQTLTAAGASMTFAAMASDVFADFLALPAAEVPWWLQRQATIDLGQSGVDVAGLNVFMDESLVDGTLLAGDRRAIDYRETGPIRLQALNIPNGGIDIALVGYQGNIVQDDRGLVSVAIGPIVP